MACRPDPGPAFNKYPEERQGRMTGADPVPQAFSTGAGQWIRGGTAGPLTPVRA